MRSQLIIATTLFLSGTFAWGQELSKRWSLEECIRYAIEHNIDLKQKEQDQESRRVELHTSKFSWLPDLNANVGQNFDFGRSPSKSGVIVDQNSANTSASVSLSMPIFDGLRIPNDIAARKLDLKAAVETLNKAKEDLSINVASYYLQVLYNKEVQKIAELQVALSNEQVVKTEALVKNGKVPLSQLYDMKAQLAKDEVSLTEARNNVKLALLDLTQSLELERDGENFDIVVPEIEDAVEQYMGSILPPDNVYDHAVASKPTSLSPGYTSAWRVVLYGTTPGVLTDSHLLELLNPDPDSRYDFSWVKPGLAVWDWRINGAVWDGFTYGMSYPSWVRMVDFAAEQGFKYLVLDANWYGPEFESDSDPVKGEKAQDVQRLLKYGKEKGVGIWLYLNDVGGRKYPIEKTLKQYGDWGAVGVKYGFMSGTQEEKNRWTKKITELCAQNHLLVDFHDGPVHPYGQMRTWPNAVTREYCHAQLDGHHVFEPKTFVTTVFVNMVAGPIDMNNGMFDLRQGHTTRVDESQPVPSTLVSEAARTLIAFSGVTILPDIPEYYRKYPALLNFLSAQKMPWKESRTLAGEIGEYIVMMRETEDAYLVGAATNESGRTIDLPLSFLEKGKYTVEVIEDGDDAHYLTNRESLKVTTRQLTNNDKLTLKLAPGGGACLVIKKTPSMRVGEQAAFPLVSPSGKIGRK